eukprot:3969744-Pyramimonas_sp.AAC.1
MPLPFAKFQTARDMPPRRPLRFQDTAGDARLLFARQQSTPGRSALPSSTDSSKSSRRCPRVFSGWPRVLSSRTRKS